MFAAYRDACRASHYLGYSNEETEGKSWYSYVHPDDLPDIAYKHRVLCEHKDGSVMCLLRMQTASSAWLWLHAVFTGKDYLHQHHCKRSQHLIQIIYQVLRYF
ncbi:unnamed protein product [Gongylonema pulchrum]|uniref:PAS domain-containing protein n=1 Tax=Gongylonema pulchrum TaxID=637853 RepID=A0A3P6TP04_9BILA|nr:unnamed protein product [Gongylonema pulchrum]